MADTLTRIQVSGTYQDPNRPDFPVEGKIVQFVPNAKRILNAGGATICIPQTLNVVLDSNGSFSVPLIATNDPDGTPTGWTYTVKEPFGTDPYPILVPFDSPGLAVDLVDIAPAASSSGGTVQLVGGIGISGVSLSDDGTALVFDMSDGSSQTSPALPYATTTAVGLKADSSTVTALTTTVGQKVGKGEQTLNAKDFGATGNGTTDDTTNLNTWIAALASTGIPGVLPAGTYKVTPGIGTSPNQRAITAVAGAKFTGTEGQSIIKLANSVGNYATVIGHNDGTDVSDFTMSGVTIDQNSANNAVVSAGDIAGGPARQALKINLGSRIRITGCHFTNIESSQTVLIGADVFDTMISQNVFDNVGGTTSTTPHDHSTVYVNSGNSATTTADGVSIIDNTFRAAVLGAVGSGTAIETHGSKVTVRGNRIENYFKGMNVTGVALGTDNQKVTDNIITGCRFGIIVFADTYSTNTAGPAFRGLDISRNQIEVELDAWHDVRVSGGTGYGIGLSQAGVLGGDDLKINDNQIRFRPITYGGDSGATGAAGIDWDRSTAPTAPSHNWQINGNQIDSPLANGIRIGKENIIGLEIAGNQVRNPGSDPQMPQGSRDGIQIFGTYTLARVHNNQVVDDRSTARLFEGVDWLATSVLSECESVDNKVSVADAAWSGRPLRIASSSLSGDLFVRSRVKSFLNPLGPAAFGSEIIDRTNGITYKQTIAPTGTNWAAQTASSATKDFLLNGSHNYREPFTRFLAGVNVTGALTSGVEYMVAVPVIAGDVVTNVTFIASTAMTIGTNADGNMYMALRLPDGTLLSQSAAQGGSATFSGAKTLALGTPYTVTADGYLYACVMVAVGTGGTPVMPTLRGVTASSTSVSVGITGQAHPIAGTTGTALTTTAPAGPLSPTASGNFGYCVLS